MYSNDPIYPDFAPVKEVRIWPWVLAGLLLVAVTAIEMYGLGMQHEREDNLGCVLYSWGREVTPEKIFICPSDAPVNRVHHLPKE